MFKDIVPYFNIGRILKKEMFHNITNYQKNFIDLYFKDYSDGILKGVSLIIRDGYIVITDGMVKHEGRIYTLEGEYNLPYYATGDETVIKIRFIDKSINNEFTIYSSEIFLDRDIDIKKDELELARFKLKEGSKLKTDYKSFKDISAPNNTLNIINVKYSAPYKSTISPTILKHFSEEISKNKAKDIYDIKFSMECMKNNHVDRELILYYISNKLDTEYKEYSNEQIYRHLLYILNESK